MPKKQVRFNQERDETFVYKQVEVFTDEELEELRREEVSQKWIEENIIAAEVPKGPQNRKSALTEMLRGADPTIATAPATAIEAAVATGRVVGEVKKASDSQSR